MFLLMMLGNAFVKGNVALLSYIQWFYTQTHFSYAQLNVTLECGVCEMKDGMIEEATSAN